MKSVLVHIDPDASQQARLQAALDVARCFGAHLTCAQVSPLDAFLAPDPYGIGYMLGQTLEHVRERQDEERGRIEAMLRVEGASWDWVRLTGSPAMVLADRAWLTDLIVLGLPNPDWRAQLQSPPIVADVVLRARVPVLAVPEQSRSVDFNGLAMVAWDGSPEACQALRAAMPLLRAASGVVLASAERGEDAHLEQTEAAAYLSRHGVPAEIATLSPGGRAIADVLLAEAVSRGASYLVMGAYGHSRLRERLLGGVTQDMLDKSTVPLVLAH